MKFLKRLIITVLAALTVASVAVAPLPVEAQGVNLNGLQVQPFYTQYIGGAITAVSTDVALYIKYVGSTSQAATVAVAAADSDVTLQVAAANDTTVNVQSGGLGPCGATPGVLDTADTDCDTLGELVDHINASANWAAVIVAGLRSDATANTLLTVVATDAKVPTGVAVLWETPQALAVSLALLPRATGDSKFLPGADLGIVNWLNRDTGNAGLGTARGGALAPRPFNDRDTTLLYASENVTSAGAVGNFIAYCVYETYTSGRQVASSENVVTLYQEAGAATTVTGKIDEFTTAGGLVCSGGKLFVRISATVGLTAPTVVATGFQRVRKQ